MLVAPVTEKGATSRRRYLPKGEWFDFWTGAKATGGREIERTVDLATMPLYVRAGAVIPTGPVRQYDGDTVPGNSLLTVYPGADGTSTLYDDDGRTFDYRNGAWMRIVIEWRDAERRLRLRLAPGSRMLAPMERSFDVRAVDSSSSTTVRFSGRTVDIQLSPIVGRTGGTMMSATPAEVRVLVFHASLRQGSLNDRLAALASQTIERLGAIVDRAAMSDFDCPSYDGDAELGEGIPAGAQALQARLRSTDAFVIAAPEYNGSMPGTLKNVIDWTSRFRPQPFNGVQAFLMSASPSMAGGNRGLWSLRVPLEHLGARVYPDMFSLAQGHQAFAPNGRLLNDVLQKRFDDTLRCFLDLVEAAKHYPQLKKQWVEFLGEHPSAATDRIEETNIEAA
jgi:chromate reductase